jgi:hypothetical protein
MEGTRCNEGYRRREIDQSWTGNEILESGYAAGIATAEPTRKRTKEESELAEQRPRDTASPSR